MSYRVSMFARCDDENSEIICCHGFVDFETLDDVCNFIKTDSVFSRCPLIEIQRGECDLFSPFVPAKDFL